MSEPLLSVRNLRVYFPIKKGILIQKIVGYVRAVDNISFDLYKGEILGVAGESGCGKTTMVRSIIRLVDVAQGEILWNGVNLLTLEGQKLLEIRRHIQMIFQDPYSSLDPRMTVGTIIAEPLEIFSRRGILSFNKTQIQEQVDELLQTVKLSPHMKNRYPHEFSGGQRQRIGIARALALRPQLLLADEPVSALDVSIQAQIINLLRDLQRTFSLTFVFIAHDLALVRYIADRVIIMYLGHVVEQAATEDIFANPLHPYTKALLSAIPIPDPNVEKKRKRILLSGEVSLPSREQKGCIFYDRCPSRMAICKQHNPAFVSISKGHKTACFLYSKEEIGKDSSTGI